ncbi:MAG TPA: Era-like GTP-binding protein [Candidatus Thermoplasmatota archaeon]|nr:Era-like GTP-binding protein [Candidatus Thermoplasmatota archaeon]
MGVFDWLKKKLSFAGLFRKKKGFRMGIYGSPNAGKTTLANAMCRDYTGDVMGTVSEVPHETRRVLTKQQVIMQTEQGTLIVDVMDTPGLASKVNAMDFELMYNMDSEVAAKRAEEARIGIVEAIEALDTLDAMLLVLDAADDPLQQVNQVLLTHVQARKLPMLIVANKIDLPDADVGRIQKMFQRHPVVGISAKTGENLDQLYDKLIRTFGA